MEWTSAVEGKVQVHCHGSEDSYPKCHQVAWVRETHGQEVEQMMTPEGEGVGEKLAGEEQKEEVEYSEGEKACDGPGVGSSLEVGWE